MNLCVNSFDFSKITRPLLAWYGKNARVLPWREDPSPYRVFVSEIMLQQTRVEAAKPYFDLFVSELPDFEALAACGEDRLMKLWEGLGYYNRARNLQKAARAVVTLHGGRLPASYDALLSLPGVGEYTAGAVASIAFSLPAPAVDGNVLRVLARLSAYDGDITKTEVKTRIREEIKRILPPVRPGDFNQALMELGAVVCQPNGEPKCGLCPLAALCEGKKRGTAAALPVKPRKKARKIEERTVFVLLSGKKAVLARRPDTGLLASLFELPNIVGWLDEQEARDALSGMGITVDSMSPLPDAAHVFSHIEWHMKGYLVRASSSILPDGWVTADKRMLSGEYALPSAFRAYVGILMEHL